MNRPPSRKQELRERLVGVARGTTQAEAELIQGLLRSEGVPSVLRRTAGFDVPEFLLAGPRDVLVAEAHVGRARQTLGESRGDRSSRGPGSSTGATERRKQ
jgi:hypothetical protein